MFYRTIFVCLVGFVLVKLVKMDPSVIITFNISLPLQSKGSPAALTCDHTEEKLKQSIEKYLSYTVCEGENFTIVTKYNNAINHIICHANTNNNHFTPVNGNVLKNETTFTGAKIMGTIWKCEILAHRDNGVIASVIDHIDNDGQHKYSAAYCYMQIHVRQKVAPQAILVNNMELSAVRTNLSQKDVDFVAEYQYVNGDVVNVICMKKCDTCNNMLTMEYNMAGITSDKSTMDELKSSKMVGFTTRLHSGHNNSYMKCTHTENDDFTTVMVRFVKRTEFNIIDITINGMVLRPHLYNAPNNYYRIDYKYVINKHINVTCEVKRPEHVKKLLMYDEDFMNKIRYYNKTESISKKKFETTNFYLTGEGHDQKLECCIDYSNGTLAETVAIVFNAGIFPTEEYPLHMELPSNGRVMELYNDYKVNVIFYEFKNVETLQLKCGQLPLTPPPARVLRLELYPFSEICETKDCPVSKNWTVTRENKNTPIVCYLKEKNHPSDTGADTGDTVLRKIKVILREKVMTTTTTSTTTTTTTTTSVTTPTVEQPALGEIVSTDPADVEPRTESENDKSMLMKLAIIACCVVCIIIICASVVIIKLRKRNHSQGGPHNRNYQNLQEPSESSIPAYPPQWENNYAVPVDRRTDDTTYSVPCPPADLYATPMPKSLRNKKQKPLDPTYAVLTVPRKGQKNIFKETEDPNYSEVYANRPEACYAKVLPKRQRNKAEQDNPYSYVTNERPCAFAADPEPMYCEPGKARDVEYANLNNSLYANSNVPEYVEPTYCEPQKRMK